MLLILQKLIKQQKEHNLLKEEQDIVDPPII